VSATRDALNAFVVAAAREQQSRPHRIAPMLRAECWGLKPNPRDEGVHDTALRVIRCSLCAAILALDSLGDE
jgi:hypothetical protein